MEKYEYIDKIIKLRDSKTNNKTIHIEKSNISFLNIGKDTLKILKAYLKKYEQSDKVNKSYNVLKKKFKVLQIYMNIALFAVSLKYIDIIVKVKHGGIVI